MKLNLFIAAALCAFVIGMNDAKAADGGNCLNLAGCTAALTGDSGTNLRKCVDDGPYNCDCTSYAWASGLFNCPETKLVSSGYSCGSGWSHLADTATGKKCCAKDPALCPLKENSAATDTETSHVVKSSNNEGVEEAFTAGDAHPLSEAYFGYNGTTLLSPTGGRGTLPEAAMDSCMGKDDVNYLKNNYSAGFNRWNACVNDTTRGCPSTAKNEHCRATGYNDGSSVTAAVCKDRCDCAFGLGTYGTCENN